MLTLRVFRAALTEEEAGKFDSAVQSLSARYQAVLGPAIGLQADTLGVEAKGLASTAYSRMRDPYADAGVVRAELFTDGANLFILSLTSSEHAVRMVELGDGTYLREEVETDTAATLECYFIGDILHTDRADEFRHLSEQAFPVELRPHLYTSEGFRNLSSQEEVAPPEMPAADDLAAAHVLADRDARILATKIKTSGGLLIGDLVKQLPEEAQGRAEEIRDSLKSVGLIESEIVLVCKKSQARINRVPSEEALRALSSQGVRCACGRDIADERVEEAVTITEVGRSLLDRSLWLLLLLIEQLLELGIPLQKILVEHQIGGDEMDCFADVSGELILFELKDKEFSLGNAYPFSAKIGITQPDHSVIVTTEYVGGDAKEHFQRAEAAGGYGARRRRYSAGVRQTGGVRYIEGISDLKEGLCSLFTDIYAGDAARLLNRVLAFASMDPQRLLEAIQRRQVDGAPAQQVSSDPGAEPRAAVSK